MSEERTHKAHHPSHSGKKAEKKAKGKEKHYGLNEKVPSKLSSTTISSHSLYLFAVRHSHPSLDAKQRDKAVVPQKKIRPASMFLSLTAPPTTSLRQL